ncbi:chemotaxis protein CheW [Sphingomonas fuzhouensis]|uniref:chemotaxis protein CheW n=1 Tax=Sphingomonas fuzhouensis TaxID=3106033 RepID=UPI002AFFBEF8|nr:chemotaxis protein CheW [Sphingomonas sp. SGZ-02]
MSGETEAVVFAIDGALFALPVTRVREILDRRPAFRVPSAPDWLVGLIDLRGQSVAVIDLRAFATATHTEAGDGARILIVETGEHGPCLGLLVDQVVDVACHANADRQDVPAIVPQRGPWRLSGVLRRGEAFVGLLDMEAIAALADDARYACEAVAA